MLGGYFKINLWSCAVYIPGWVKDISVMANVVFCKVVKGMFTFFSKCHISVPVINSIPPIIGDFWNVVGVTIQIYKGWSIDCTFFPIFGVGYTLEFISPEDWFYSCLAGDIFGIYRFKSRLRTGSIVRLSDAAGYTIVKKNWFNGLKTPSIAVKRLSGKVDIVKRFNYRDFVNSLS